MAGSSEAWRNSALANLGQTALNLALQYVAGAVKLRLVAEILGLWLGCLIVLLATLGLTSMRQPWQDENDDKRAA